MRYIWAKILEIFSKRPKPDLSKHIPHGPGAMQSSWLCGHCHLLNEWQRTHCIGCGTPRPLQAPPADAPHIPEGPP